jgi:hypothetical protein
MKKLIFPLFLILSVFTVKAQKTDVPDLDKIEIKDPNDLPKIKSAHQIPDLNSSVTEEKNVVVPRPKASDSEIAPEFPGGIDKFYDFLNKNIIIPKREHFKGNVWVTFVIDYDGSVVDAKIKESPASELVNNLVISALIKSPKWDPGIQNNRAVRVLYTMPLSFK